MKYLLDTHTLIWYSSNSADLSDFADQAITNEGNDIAVSIVSFWEIAIKTSTGKLSVQRSLQKLASDVRDQDIAILDISISALDRLAELPWIHKDPFDRLIAVTALDSGLTLLSKDEIFDQYGVARKWQHN